MDNAPHTSTSRPSDVIHVIDVPRPSPFFAPLPRVILNENRRTKNGGGPGMKLVLSWNNEVNKKIPIALRLIKGC